MWYGPFYAFGKAARLVASAGTLPLSPWRGQAGSAKREERGKDGNGFLAKLLHRGPDGLPSAAVAAAVATGRVLLDRPSVRASLEDVLARLLGGGDEELQSVEAMSEDADKIAAILLERGVTPKRIGVDGLPGSGKSTLARALARKLGWVWRTLDHENMSTPRDFAAERTVYEHHRLLRTQDVDVFEAIVYVDEPMEASKARVLARARKEARETLNVYVLDYEKLRQIGKFAFDVCEGVAIPVPESSLFVKVKPTEGFHATQNIASRLHAVGRRPERMSKEEMLFLLVYGRPRDGLIAYVLPRAVNDELLRGLLSGMREYLAD